MKGWRKPKAFAAAYSAQKRFLAFVLTLSYDLYQRWHRSECKLCSTGK